MWARTLKVHRQVKVRVQELMGNLSGNFAIHITPEKIIIILSGGGVNYYNNFAIPMI